MRVADSQNVVASITPLGRQFLQQHHPTPQRPRLTSTSSLQRPHRPGSRDAGQSAAGGNPRLAGWLTAEYPPRQHRSIISEHIAVASAADFFAALFPLFARRQSEPESEPARSCWTECGQYLQSPETSGEQRRREDTASDRLDRLVAGFGGWVESTGGIG